MTCLPRSSGSLDIKLFDSCSQIDDSLSMWTPPNIRNSDSARIGLENVEVSRSG
jgi:hypothetical protein